MPQIGGQTNLGDPFCQTGGEIMSEIPGNIRFMPNWELLRARAFLFVFGSLRRMTMGVRAAMVDGDKVFLARHAYISGWHLPGGGIEAGEPAALSLEREVLEETGHQLTGPGELHAIYLNTQASRRDHVLVYVCRDFEFAFERRPDHEIADLGWFDRHELPDGTTDGTRRRLEEIFEGIRPTDEW